MDILITYLQNGKILSTKKILSVLAVIALFFSLLFSGLSYSIITRQSLSEKLNTLPVIEINNGIVEKPVDTFYEIVIPENQIRFVLNTKISDSPKPENNTIILTKNALYATVQNQVQKVDLPKEKTTIDKDFLIKTFKIGIAEIGLFSFIFLLIILVIGFYGAYWLSYLFLKVFQKEADKNNIKKTAFIGWLSVIALNTVLMMTGHGFSALNAMFMAAFISVFCLFQIKN